MSLRVEGPYVFLLHKPKAVAPPLSHPLRQGGNSIPVILSEASSYELASRRTLCSAACNICFSLRCQRVLRRLGGESDSHCPHLPASSRTRALSPARGGISLTCHPGRSKLV